MDWQKIKTEYITTDTSYRKLAQKYGVRYATVQKRAKDEDWGTLRDQFRTTTVSKSVSKISDLQSDRAARLQTVTDKLLARIEALVDGSEPLSMGTQSLRHIAATLKDIKEIQGIRSDADMREQEARIANLQRQAEKDDKDKGKVAFVLEGALKDYAQ